MQKKKKLEDRLAACGNGEHVYPAVCWLDTLCYFYALSADMRGDFYYSDIYNCMASDDKYGEVSDSFIAEVLSKAYRGEMPELVCDEIIYRILIEPFCDNHINWKKGGR
ncbi:MAG: hypothetical protein HDQ97_15500 [Lachnospiraceae bacterium]|nr:hypothetical protein [Lachnospiraceae bacterium]